jgi:TonB family protein
VVLVEARVDGAGAVVGLKVMRSAPPFDEPAIDAARQWTFRPARLRGKPVTSLVYIMFGFQSPVA